jgi:hypothetical protein
MIERRVAREPLAAVIVGKDYQRILRNAASLECSENRSDALIGTLEHTHVVSTRGRDRIVWLLN